jgi:hypothetical protein
MNFKRQRWMYAGIIECLHWLAALSNVSHRIRMTRAVGAMIAVVDLRRRRNSLHWTLWLESLEFIKSQSRNVHIF